MARFKVGDKVRIDDVGFRGVRGVVEEISSEEHPIYTVRVVTGPKKGKREYFKVQNLELLSSTKSLRAKYKAAPKRDMVLIGEWDAPESGHGYFYAPRNRRSQVERTFLAIEEGDESKEAFYSVINAGGVFVRD